MIAMDVSPARSAVRIRLFYFIEILHQTTTATAGVSAPFSLYLIEILHQTTTQQQYALEQMELYLIEILHQTTTAFQQQFQLDQLYLIEILHQTTTFKLQVQSQLRCILLKFYIKPQLSCRGGRRTMVVSY